MLLRASSEFIGLATLPSRPGPLATPILTVIIFRIIFYIIIREKISTFPPPFSCVLLFSSPLLFSVPDMFCLLIVIVGTNNNNYTNTKHHKQKKPRKNIPVDFSEYPALVDFSHLERLAPDLRSRVRLVEPKRVINSKYFGDIKEIYTFDDHKGFYVIPNPFTPEQQRYWVRRCVRELTVGNPTNVSNLDGNATLWSEWKPEYMRTLRWTSVGYHFQWTERVYRDDKRGPFPPDMRGSSYIPSFFLEPNS